MPSAVPLAAAIAAILLWSSLATLSVSLSGVPPLFLIGVALSLGGLLSLPWARQWTLRWKSIAIGCYGMLGYHLLFVLALRNAPPINANLVHYTWPMLIVLLSPLFRRGNRIGAIHVIGAACGFVGATLAILDTGTAVSFVWAWGYAAALAAALIWSTYSLSISRVGTGPTTDVGLACLASGCVCLALHMVLEPKVDLSGPQALSLLLLGMGPMGAAFYFWSYAMKRGDPRVVGVLANATPLLSTCMLAAAGQGSITATLIVAALLVSVASLLVVLRHASPPTIPSAPDTANHPPDEESIARVSASRDAVWADGRVAWSLHFLRAQPPTHHGRQQHRRVSSTIVERGLCRLAFRVARRFVVGECRRATQRDPGVSAARRGRTS